MGKEGGKSHLKVVLPSSIKLRRRSVSEGSPEASRKRASFEYEEYEHVSSSSLISKVDVTTENYNHIDDIPPSSFHAVVPSHEPSHDNDKTMTSDNTLQYLEAYVQNWDPNVNRGSDNWGQALTVTQLHKDLHKIQVDYQSAMEEVEGLRTEKENMIK